MAIKAPTGTNRNQGSIALNAFFKIGELWQLTNGEQMILLGLNNESTFYKWKNHPETARLDPDKIERISYLLGIYKDLQNLLGAKATANAWVRQPNTAPLFGGRSALDLMLQGRVADLFLVRQYLHSQKA